ncbi:MAG: DNA mismatch repair protein MutS [Caldimicrobium sp.]
MKGQPKQEITPMFRQYFEIKAKYADAILFFRLGDFYEMFFEDAETVAPLLSLVLTKREAGKNLTAPMCGIPVEKSEIYIQKLLELGFKVAICEQVEDPALAKGLVKREVVKVYTPGLFIDLGFLKDKEKTYLSSLKIGKKIALSFLELSCEEFYFTELPQDKALSELLKKEPREILLEDTLKESEFAKVLKQNLPQVHLTFLEKEEFKKFKEKFAGISESEESKEALSAIYSYLKRYQPALAERLLEPKFYYPEEFLYLDENAKRNLELVRNLWDGTEKYTLYWVLDKTKTPMGSRLLKEWILYPLRDLKTILERQKVIEFFLEKRDLREKLAKILEKLSDLERLGSRLSLRLINPKELALLREGLRFLPELKIYLKEARAFFDCPEELKRIEEDLGEIKEIFQLLDSALSEDPPSTLKEGGIFKRGFNKEIDELKDLRENSLLYLSKLEEELKVKTGIPTLKIGFNRVFGYYVEVSKSYLKMVPSYFERKQTLVNAERFMVPELKKLEEKILSAEEKLKNLEYELFLQLREEIAKEAETIKRSARALAKLDVFIALSEVAEKYHYVCPEITEEKVLYIEEGRHPVLERILGEENFIPNSLELKEGETEFLIITGPNMGGKSTFLRQNALIVILAHMGSFVPAKAARIGVFDKIFTRIGAGDELIRGKSTFMVEMSECARILKHATSRSLVILDEVGRGTSTFDGMSLAWAIAEYLYKNKVFTLLATHYFELTELAKNFPGIKNFHAEVREWQDQVIFLYRILPGAASQSYGIEVARLAELPEEVIKRAKEILDTLEKRKPKFYKKQLSLFLGDENSVIIDKIKKVNPDQLTPKEALEFLYQLKRELEKS